MKLIAKGNTAEIYEYGDNLICKLFYPQYPTEYIEHEFHNATTAWKLGIRTPKAHKIIIEGERQGIIYDQIVGEVLSIKFSNPSEPVYDEWMDRFVNFHKQLMQYNLDDAISYKDFLKMFTTDEETIAKINALADGNCFIHGDFHLDNVMLDENNNVVLIDMMNVCKGTELYDVARTYFLLRYDKNIQSKYMKKMGYSVEDIMPYLDVILMIRENEMKRYEEINKKMFDCVGVYDNMLVTVTACGECCTGCPKKEKGICRGCIEADGYVPEWAESGRCKVHECARNHNVQFCGICREFPCEKLTSVIHWNPDIVDHLKKLALHYFAEQKGDHKAI